MGNRESGMVRAGIVGSWLLTIPYSLFPIPGGERRLSGFRLHRLCLLERLVDAADHVERLLRQVVALAVADHLEAADGFLQRDVLARRAGEDLGDGERLREEALDLARARDRLLVFFAELVHAEEIGRAHV